MLLPPLNNTFAREFARIVAGSQDNIADIPDDIIQPMRNSNTIGQRRKIMIKHLYGFLGVERAFPIEVADELFFLTSILKIGFPVA